MAETHAHLGHHFESLEQQHEANTLGMWLFLVTELLLFGGMFAAYVVYRTAYPEAFAEGSRDLNVVFGTVNTAVLITSSLFVALGVHAAQVGNRRSLMLFLGLTILLGLTFLGIKGIEYYEHFQHGLVPGARFHYEGPHAAQVHLFTFLYFVMTGIHAIHMVIGMAVIGGVLAIAARGGFSPHSYTGVELAGLYWHFVDVIWIFIFPLLYLYGRV